MMEQPVPFIATGEDGTGLVVDSAAKEILAKIDKPVVVVSVVGLYRTGKSFLLNRLMNRTDGFPLGATVEAKTKGIWMWVGDLPGDPTRALVLLDTEGLHDPEKGDTTHDVRIFTLAVLLSSVLIYNSKGTIDASSLDGLHLATQLTSHISSRACQEEEGEEEETGDDFAQFFPMLIWAVRDHHLKLNVSGQEISAKQYLENCLALKQGRTPQVAAYNNLRETIRAFFQNRNCFLFPTPTTMDNLENLEHMRLEELDPGFIQAGDSFNNFVTGQAPSKTVKGKEMTGSMWSTLAEQYVSAIIAGSINIESAYDSMTRKENTKSSEAAFEAYKAEMNQLTLPQEMEALITANTKAHATATEIFLKTAVNGHNNQEYADSMNRKLQECLDSIFAKNERASEQTCMQILGDLYQAIGDKVSNGGFTHSGGHQAYKNEVWLFL